MLEDPYRRTKSVPSPDLGDKAQILLRNPLMAFLQHWQLVHTRKDSTFERLSKEERLLAKSLEEVNEILANGTFFWTRRGYLGICRDGVAQVDEVWLLRSCPTPFILRRTNFELAQTKSKNAWRRLRRRVGVPCHELLGTAYVRGITRGEFFESGLEEWKEVYLR